MHTVSESTTDDIHFDEQSVTLLYPAWPSNQCHCGSLTALLICDQRVNCTHVGRRVTQSTSRYLIAAHWLIDSCDVMVGLFAFSRRPNDYPTQFNYLSANTCWDALYANNSNRHDTAILNDYKPHVQYGAPLSHSSPLIMIIPQQIS